MGKGFCKTSSAVSGRPTTNRTTYPKRAGQAYIVAQEDAAVVRAADTGASGPSAGGSALGIEFGEVLEALPTLHRPVADGVAPGVAVELVGSVWSP
jgi:hypothetical protein